MKYDRWTFTGSYPLRVVRMSRHLKAGLRGIFRESTEALLPGNRFLRWWMEWGFFLIDLLALPDMYNGLACWVKPDTRSLSGAEIRKVRAVFGDSLAYDRVKVDERAMIACRRFRICYVSFFTINHWGPLSSDLLVHELMHVWQYMNIGAVYIPRALLAQRTAAGYDYGGITALRAIVQKKGGLDDFNLEQQAEIVADYYRLSNRLSPVWCEPDTGYLPVFEYFIKEVKGRAAWKKGERCAVYK